MSSAENIAKRVLDPDQTQETPSLAWIQTVWYSDGIPERIFRKSWFWTKSADEKKACKMTQYYRLLNI